MFDPIATIAHLLGVPAAYVPLILMIIVAVSNIIGKLIPESATGWLGTARKIANIIGLYVSNRITPNITQSDVTKSIAATVPDMTIIRSAEGLPKAVETGVQAGAVARAIVDAASGKTPGRPYVAGESPEPGSQVPDEFRTDGGRNA